MNKTWMSWTYFALSVDEHFMLAFFLFSLVSLQSKTKGTCEDLKSDTEKWPYKHPFSFNQEL